MTDDEMSDDDLYDLSDQYLHGLITVEQWDEAVERQTQALQKSYLALYDYTHPPRPIGWQRFRAWIARWWHA